MSSPHFSASFRNSCVIAPRHPKTNLPTTVVERKSFDFSELNNSGRQKESKYSKQSKFNRDKRRSGSKSEQVIESYQASPSVYNNIQGRYNSFSNKKTSKSQRPLTAPPGSDNELDQDNGFSLFDSRDSVDIHNLINDDDKFFAHLQALKSENKKTLKSLETLYNSSLRESVNGYNSSQRESVTGYNTKSSNVNTHGDFSHTKTVRDDIYKDNIQNERYYTKVNSSFRSSSVNNADDCILDDLERSFENALHNDRVLNLDGKADKDAEDFDFSSEDELDQQLKVQVPKDHINILPDREEDLFRGRSSSYDVIANMWDNFSVDEYVPYATFKKAKKKNDWSPTITIPEPFQMTKRDEMKAKRKSKRVEQIEHDLHMKQLQEEAELQKRVIPTPIPPSTFLPLYDELTAHQEKKRAYVRDLSKQILKCTEKPFKFIKREEAKKDLKRSVSLNSLFKKQKEDKKNKQFKASPYPDKLFDLTLADKQAEEEEYRRIKIKLRSQEMLASSSLPANMRTRNMKYYPARAKTRQVKEELRKRKEKSFQPAIHYHIPDFETLQKKVDIELEERKNNNIPTVAEPFDLHTANVPKRRSEFRKSVERNKIIERPPSGRPHSRGRLTDKTTDSPQLCRSYSATRSAESPVFSLNETSRLRQERIYSSLEKQKQDDLKQSIAENQKYKSQSKLRKNVAKKALAQDPARNRPKESMEKMKSFREADQARRKEYQQYLKDMKKDLDTRPLLFERESQTNAKHKAQRRYEEILRAAGIEGNILESVLQDSYRDGGVMLQPEESDGSSDNEFEIDSQDGSYIMENSGDHSGSINQDELSDISYEDNEDETEAVVSDAEAASDTEESDDGSYKPTSSNNHQEYSEDEI